MRRSWAIPFAALAGFGAVASAVIHLLALAGVGTTALFDAAVAAFAAVFIVWMPAFLAGERMVRGVGWRGWWRTAESGAPRWMRRLAPGLLVYAVVVFSIFALWRLGTGRAADQIAQVRLLSAYAMGFHGVAFSVFYSYLHLDGSRAKGTRAPGKPI